MKTEKQNPDFLYLGEKLVKWYDFHGRNLPFRENVTPYNIWISEVIFQQTRIQQGLEYYQRFIHRFPTVDVLAKAPIDEVLLYWKGLGYYSRAINLHKTSIIIMKDYAGVFPTEYQDILALPGIGKYTAAAIMSIGYQVPLPAVDGNLYRVLSRFFADDYDISLASAYQYFSDLATRLMPIDYPGEFNQAMMDLGSSICMPKIVLCEECPLSEGCLSLVEQSIFNYPKKSKKVKAQDEDLKYFYVHFGNEFTIQKRNASGIWKNLYELTTVAPDDFESENIGLQVIKHKLTHRNLTINIELFQVNSRSDLKQYAKNINAEIIELGKINEFSMPKPIDAFLHSLDLN